MSSSTRTAASMGWRLGFIVVVTALTTGCPPKYPKCKDDNNCAEHGEVCVNGTCKQCRDDSQCKPGYQCKDGACVEKPQCTTDADCKDGLVCRNQKCVPQCTTDADCGPNQKCVNQKCVAKVECDETHPCPDGQTCQDGKCVEAPPPPAPPQQQCTLQTIYFDFDDASLTEAARSTLESDAECIKKANRPVRIEGNCDDRGTEEYNINLGNRRADSARRYLEGLGVPDNLLSVVSYGKERPVDPGHNEAAWAKNRRDDFVWQ